MKRAVLLLLGAVLIGGMSLTTGQTSEAASSNTWTWNAAIYDDLRADGYAVLNDVQTQFAINGAAVAADAQQLRITDRSATGYKRELFPHWSDLDGDGIDTRNEILARDLAGITWTTRGDRVATGTLLDPYTGSSINFERASGDGGGVDIDHLVPLAAAWTGGANTWSAQQREAFANDPENLLAVSASANREKSDALASEWLPQHPYRCVYVAQLTHVLTKYSLAVTTDDKTVLARTARGCALPDGWSAAAAQPQRSAADQSSWCG